VATPQSGINVTLAVNANGKVCPRRKNDKVNVTARMEIADGKGEHAGSNECKLELGDYSLMCARLQKSSMCCARPSSVISWNNDFEKKD
jgi:hypothetical protein